MNAVDQPHPRRHPLVGFAHLVARFVTSLPSTPPPVDHEVWVEDHLLPGERDLWVRMNNQDRRHSALVARRFAAKRPGATRAEIAGAILHDVGKIDCRLGTFSRSAARVVGPRTDRFRSYLDHEAVGARMAVAAGSDPVTVELIAGEGPLFSTLVACDRA